MQKELYPSAPVMIVDDEIRVLKVFRLELMAAGITHIIIESDSRNVINCIQKQVPQILLLDLSMPNISGHEILKHMAEHYPEVPVIVVTGIDDVQTAVECMRAGAIDYLVKPVEEGLLPAVVKRAIRFREMDDQMDVLKASLFSYEFKRDEAFNGIITHNEKMLAIFQYAQAVAITPQPVLITGETGVGKELFAKAIHTLSKRKGQFVAVNIAGLDDVVFSDTLFGHHKGAFTGADKLRKGAIETAVGGTLFLDEIGDLNTTSQVKLLRLLQEGEFLPLGCDIPKRTDSRIVAATNCNLQKAQQDGKFRKDLYYRLRSHHIHIPPLRERRDDLPLLLDYYLQKFTVELSKAKPTVPGELIDLLGAYSFPGNVREFESMVSDAISIHKKGILSTHQFRAYINEQIDEQSVINKGITQNNKGDSTNPFSDWLNLPTLKDADRLLMQEALKRSNQNIATAAKTLGISHEALRKRIKRQSSS